jgi:Protein of unknown function (DUF3307)
MTWHLFLAHFLADYPLQPGWMAHNKRRPHVMLGHVSVHFLVMLLLAGESRGQVWPFLLALTLAHLMTDISKETVHWLRPKWVIGPYVIDQMIHYGTILLTGAWIERAVGPVRLPFSPQAAILLTAYLVGTYVWFISERIFVYADPSYREEVQALLWPRMVTRAAMLTGMLWILQWSGGSPGRLSGSGAGGLTGGMAAAAGVAVSVPYLSGKHRQRAFLTDVIVSLSVAILTGVAMWQV